MAKKDIKLLVLPAVPGMNEVIKKFPFALDFTRGQFCDLEIIIKNQKLQVLHQQIELKNYSFVWLSSYWNSRDLAFAVEMYLQKNRIKHTSVEKSTSKLTDHVVFCQDKIVCPDTLFFGHRNIKRIVLQIKKVCGFPIIIKDIRGSRGANAKFILDEKELKKEIVKLPKEKRFIFQKFIPNKYDWGVMVANGVVVSGEKSYPKVGEFRNNVCNGAKEVFIDVSLIPKNIKKIAIAASQSLGLNWSRVDIIIDKYSEKPYVMEVNRLPGITSKTSEVEGAYKFLAEQLNKVNS
ncbi:MAG: hypothetical protein WCT18_01145 [Patescibacteria group bacterium]